MPIFKECTIARFKNFLKLAIGIFVLLVWSHDDGRPDTLSESDQAYVMQQAQASEDRMVDILDKIDRFVCEPNREVEMAEALASAVDSWREIDNKIESDGRFYVKCDDDRYASQIQRLLQLNNDFDDASEILVREILSRLEREECDPKVFDILCPSFSQAANGSPENHPCDKRRCFWCRSKRILTF